MITYLTLQPRESKKGPKTQILIQILLIKLNNFLNIFTKIRTKQTFRIRSCVFSSPFLVL